MDMMGMGMMDMGMMDMGMGMGMMDMGMMDMGMGMGMMGMGAMDMGMGMGIMGAQMMGMGALGMGMGMRRGIGYCQPGCMSSCCRTVVICPSNCTGPCCSTRRIITNGCPPGCVRNCCSNNYNDDLGFLTTTPQLRNPQMYNNQNYQNYINLPPRNNPNIMMNQTTNNPNMMVNQTTNNPNMMMNQTPNNNLNDIQQQRLIEQQIRIENEKKKQMAQKQMLQKEELMINQQNLIMKQKQMQQQKLVQQQMQLKFTEQQKLQQANQINQNQQVQLKQSQQIASNQMNPLPSETNPYKQQQQILFEADVYQKVYGKWQLTNAGRLTVSKFLNLKISQICKIKIKYESQIPNTRVVKLSMSVEGDVFFSMFKQSQIQCSCRIIWAKLAAIGRICNVNQSFNGHMEGKIVRKSFFGQWQQKYCIISSTGLKLYNTMGSQATHIINSVPEIWTRFDILQGNLLVIKMISGTRKNEIGIPIQHAMSWLKAFFTLIRV